MKFWERKKSATISRLPSRVPMLAGWQAGGECDCDGGLPTGLECSLSATSIVLTGLI